MTSVDQAGPVRDQSLFTAWGVGGREDFCCDNGALM